MGSRLDGLLRKLNELPSGQQLTVHELTVLEASNEYYQEWHKNHSEKSDRLFPGRFKSEPTDLGYWFKANGLTWQTNHVTSQVTFERVLFEVANVP